MSEFLPNELIEQILAKLPLKVVLVARSVCKTWRDIISQPQFGHSHFQSAIRTKTLTHSLLLSITAVNTVPRLESVELERIPVGNTRYLPWPIGPLGRDFLLLGSCNGFVCGCVGFDEFFIWNPSTREFRPIPPPPDPASEFGYVSDTPFKHFGGFGYVSATQDYKLILSAYTEYDDEMEIFRRVRAQVFSLGNENWRERMTTCCAGAIEGQGVLVDNKLHWVLDYYKDDEENEHIIAFDLEAEKFQTMPLPFPGIEPFDDVDNYTVAVSSHQGRLCLWHYNKRAASVEYWIMGKYGQNDSWKQYFIQLSNEPLTSFLKPLMVTNSHIVLVRCSTGGQLELVRISSDRHEDRTLYRNGWESRDYQHESLMILYDHTLLSLPPRPGIP